MTQNNFGTHIHLNGALPGFDMLNIGHSKNPDAELAGPKTMGMGVKGPWHLNPGNPNFPNHRPYLTNPKPPNEAATVPPQKLKFS